MVVFFLLVGLVAANWASFWNSAKKVTEVLGPPITADEWTVYTHDVLIFYANRVHDLHRPELVRRAERHGMKGVVRFRQLLECEREGIECPNVNVDSIEYDVEV